MFEDVLAEGKYDVSEVFNSIYLDYHNISHQIVKSESAEFDLTEMKKMMMLINTKPTYPSSKLTFTISNITKYRVIEFFDILLPNLNGTFDVDVVLEASKRNFLNSF